MDQPDKEIACSVARVLVPSKEALRGLHLPACIDVGGSISKGP